MSKVDANVAVISVVVTLLVTATLGYNLYTGAEQRKAYMECLRITERLLEADKSRIGTPYCRL